ncbi:hypothetical protein IWQ61_000084 [Dispira simplex]|nr:hypothetical protein IWQ61_000084 [Dispira simplex]
MATPMMPSGYTTPGYKVTPTDLYRQLNAITKYDPDVVQIKHSKMRRMAQLMDDIPWLPLPIGLDSIIGLLPVGGDVVSALIALRIMSYGVAAGVPASYKARMVKNVAIDGLAGTVPLLGDIFDMVYKANMRNLALLEKWMQKKEKERQKVWTDLCRQHGWTGRLSSDPPVNLQAAEKLTQMMATATNTPIGISSPASFHSHHSTLVSPPPPVVNPRRSKWLFGRQTTIPTPVQAV